MADFVSEDEPRKRRLLPMLLLAILGVLIGVLVWKLDHAGSDHAPVESRTTGAPPAEARRTKGLVLDADKYRDWRATWLARAKELSAAKQPRPPRKVAPDGEPRPDQGGFGMRLMEPACILGPGDLCAALVDVVSACDDGDGDACLAIGQFLADTPPRPLIAIVFFKLACKAGDGEACARTAKIEAASGEGTPRASCDDDLLLCAWQAYRRNDEAGLDEACSLGVADACGVMFEKTRDDPVLSRAYLETACQLGNPMACRTLGERLSPQCEVEPGPPCYSPDSEQAAEALAIACAAGWDDACR